MRVPVQMVSCNKAKQRGIQLPQTLPLGKYPCTTKNNNKKQHSDDQLNKQSNK